MLLQLNTITKSFAAVRALRGVSFELQPGEVHALVGENGAGKSTLIKIITGAHAPDSGALTLAGQPISHNSPALARALGIAAIYQQPALFPDLSVAENIALSLETGSAWQRVDWRARNQQARTLLDRVGARFDVQTPVAALTMPEQQLVEIARALGADAKVLIMDEPTASLTERETEHLFRIIGELRASGVGIIYISHRLDELFVVADRVTVLRDGQSVATRAIGDVDRTELIRLMVGREVAAVFPKREVALGPTVLELEKLACAASGVRDINLTLRAGEIVGLAGLVGAGRTELAQTIFGLTPADDGHIKLDGQPLTIDSPARAIAHGIAYVPEDRHRHGAILELPIAANTTLAILQRIARNGWIDRAAEQQVAADFVQRLAIKTPATFAPVSTLSGGNQQRVALARWLATAPRVLILDEPTQGIDVGAKAEIHRLMGDLAEQGMAILMISSELPEVIGMSDRIAVMRGGRIVDWIDAGFARNATTQQRIIASAMQ